LIENERRRATFHQRRGSLTDFAVDNGRAEGRLATSNQELFTRTMGFSGNYSSFKLKGI
jgi:hypothetical protein